MEFSKSNGDTYYVRKNARENETSAGDEPKKKKKKVTYS